MIINPVGYPLKRGQTSTPAINAAIAAAITPKANTADVTAALAGKQAKVAEYTVATLQAAAAENAGLIVAVSDGNAGQPCLAYSDGVAWKVLALGAAPAGAA